MPGDECEMLKVKEYPHTHTTLTHVNKLLLLFREKATPSRRVKIAAKDALAKTEDEMDVASFLGIASSSSRPKSVNHGKGCGVFLSNNKLQKSLLFDRRPVNNTKCHLLVPDRSFTLPSCVILRCLEE